MENSSSPPAAARRCQPGREPCPGGCLSSAGASWGIRSGSLLVRANDNKPMQNCTLLRERRPLERHLLELLGPDLLFLHWFTLKIHSQLNRILPYLARREVGPSLSGRSLRSQAEPRRVKGRTPPRQQFKAAWLRHGIDAHTQHRIKAQSYSGGWPSPDFGVWMH